MTSRVQVVVKTAGRVLAVVGVGVLYVFGVLVFGASAQDWRIERGHDAVEKETSA